VGAEGSLPGALGTGVVTYPFSETLVNQTIGLEFVSLLVVAPWRLGSRRHHAVFVAIGLHAFVNIPTLVGGPRGPGRRTRCISLSSSQSAGPDSTKDLGCPNGDSH